VRERWFVLAKFARCCCWLHTFKRLVRVEFSRSDIFESYRSLVERSDKIESYHSLGANLCLRLTFVFFVVMDPKLSVYFLEVSVRSAHALKLISPVLKSVYAS
jgi:hypothetical protein